jgi:hypothetical protein
MIQSLSDGGHGSNSCNSHSESAVLASHCGLGCVLRGWGRAVPRSKMAQIVTPGMG